MSTLNWTDEQWDRHYQQDVTVNMELFERLVAAAELVASGARLSASERAKWQGLATSARYRLNAEIQSIESVD